MTTAEYFDDRTCPEPNTGCLLWTAGRDAKGYGRVSGQRPYRAGTTVLAHRLAWERLHGPVPDGLHVLHSCDTPTCVRAEHLRLGTNAENVADKMSRGRHPRGDRSLATKVSDVDLKTLRALVAFGMTTPDVGRSFGIHSSQVSRIVTGRRRSL